MHMTNITLLPEPPQSILIAISALEAEERSAHKRVAVFRGKLYGLARARTLTDQRHLQELQRSHDIALRRLRDARAAGEAH